jgi:hypothetical protein
MDTLPKYFEQNCIALEQLSKSHWELDGSAWTLLKYRMNDEGWSISKWGVPSRPLFGDLRDSESFMEHDFKDDLSVSDFDLEMDSPHTVHDYVDQLKALVERAMDIWFETEGHGDWEQLSEAYVFSKRRIHNTFHPILQNTGEMKRDLHVVVRL